MSNAKKYLLIAAGSVIAVLLIVVAAAAINPDLNPLDYLFLKPTEHSARFYPKDTLLYSYLTLYPRGQQRRHMLNLWDEFSELRSFNNILDEQKEELHDRTGIDLDEDVLPAIGPDVSLGILRFNKDGDPILAATVSVRDREKAEILLEQFLDYLEDEEGALFDKEQYQNQPVWLEEDDGQAYALTDDMIVAVAAPGDSLYWLEEMMDLIEDDSRESLADNNHFQEAMRSLPRARFASAFLNNEDHLDDLIETHWLSALFPEETVEPLIPRWEAYCLQWEKKGSFRNGCIPRRGTSGNLHPGQAGINTSGRHHGLPGNCRRLRYGPLAGERPGLSG